jgi:Mlc titration factor MtfA (ptsG expression regulator)
MTMLVTPQSNRTNRRFAMGVAVACAAISLGLGLVNPWWLLATPLSVVLYKLVRRRTVRRIGVMSSPFPDQWERALISHVAFFRALDETQKSRFRNLVKVFIDEVPITGIRTDVDETTRVLVAASAGIPIFGFDDWEYSGLGEVLIYPSAFGENYNTDDGADRNTLGMIGVNHLSGIMILSKPDLISGFLNAKDKRNVGIHEFAHLVDKADGSVDGIPAGIPAETVGPWIRWVGEELRQAPTGKSHINDYAYTNEAEYLAVLTEYFFEAPDVLEKKSPEIYRMLQSIYRQNTRSFLSSTRGQRKRIGRNASCPCGSGQKFKRCCRRNRKQGM